MSQPSSDPTAGLPAAVFTAATEALELAEPERGRAFLALCAAQPEHAPQLQRLFDELRAVERLLDDGYHQREVPPTQLGQYRVIRKLGAGAFGEVFLCEQTAPVRRSVAVKVLRAGVGDQTTLLRFEAERQIVASMQHPGLAQVFDAGTLADGRPFFVMDAIAGTPIDRYCDEHASSVEVRLELFGELCRAVQHAHDRGIVHRDLKPANVLVVEVDGRPRPKVIDFGIAKVLQGRVETRSFATETGRVVGTPGYMSPEQQQGASDAVDARADVFSLGVMLYELLCGQRPWTIGATATDTDPQRPSTRVSTSTASATAVARDRSTQPRRLASRLRGDLDWIVLKCLSRERERRYPSVQELIFDLERHRRAEPVRALPPSTAYRLRKLARRHRAAFLALASGALVTIGGVAFFASQRSFANEKIEAARAQAETTFATATEAVERLLERANDPSVREAPEGDAVRKAMLQDALSFYDRFLLERPTDPQLRRKRCTVLLRLVRIQVLLGDAQRAIVSAQLATGEAEALLALDPTRPELQGLLGETLSEAGAARSLAGDDDGARAAFHAASGHLMAAAATMPLQFGCRHASALRGAALLTQHGSEDRRQGLQSSLQVLDGLHSIAAAADVAHEYVLTACELGETLALELRLPESEAVLQQAAARLPLVTTERLHLTYRVNTLRADVAFQSGERSSTLEHYGAALAAVTAWEQAQPKRLLPRTLHARALRSLGYAQNYAGEFDHSVASYRAAVKLGDELTERFPNAATTIEQALLLEQFALTLSDRFQQSVLAEAAACIDRAVTLEQRTSGGGPSERRWRLLWLRATIADAHAAGGGDPFWPEVEAALADGPRLADDPRPLSLQRDQLVGAYTSLARWHLDHDRSEAATQWLERATAVIASDPKEHSKRAVETGWLTARIAAARADHTACAAAAERVLAARSTWYGRRRAADCMHLAWRCASKDPTATAAAANYRDRALDWYRRVGQALEKDVAADELDPWFVLPWAIASVRAAELSVAAGDPAAARPLLAAALPRLQAVRTASPADLWDEQVWNDGRALYEQLTTTGR